MNRSQTLPAVDKLPEQTQACEIEGKGDATTVSVLNVVLLWRKLWRKLMIYMQDTNDPGKLALNQNVRFCLFYTLLNLYCNLHTMS